MKKSCSKKTGVFIKCVLVICFISAITLQAHAQKDGKGYMALAKACMLKKDSVACNANLNKAITIFLSKQKYRDAAEAYLNAEEYYQAFGGTDMNVRIAWYEKALAQFQKTTAYDRKQATLRILGDFYQVQGKYAQSLTYLQEALTLEKYVKPLDKESLYDLLGSVYALTGNLNKALTYGLLAIKIVEQSKDTTMQACAVYNRVGITYYIMRHFAQSRTFFEKSLAVAAANHDVQTEINEYANIAEALISLGRFEDAIRLLKNVNRKYPPAEINRQIGIDLRLLICYTKLKKLDEAGACAARLEQTSLTVKVSSNYRLVIQDILTAYYAAAVDDKPARRHLALWKKLAEEQHNPVALAEAYNQEGQLDSVESKYKSAYQAYYKASNLHQSVWNQEQGKQAAELQMQFDNEKQQQQIRQKENRIRLLNNQARLQQTNYRQEQLTQKLIWGSVVLLSLLMLLGFKAYRSKQRINSRLKGQQLEIEQKNHALTELVHEKENLLKEKEWLMKEIHHRVKNNLQIVISLLSTQSSYLQNDVAYNAIRESQHRMQSISLIHQKLYQSDNLALVDIQAYIADLADYLGDSFDATHRIKFHLDLTAAELDVTRAVPLGLILNEAITNAIKYAFPDDREGNIFITLSAINKSAYILKIQDDGVGLPDTVDIGKRKSLGMNLMRGLSKQLGGTFKITSNNGITIEVSFITETLLQAI